MITLIRMKYKEWKLKLAFYSVIESVIKEQEDIIKTITNLYASLKNVTGQELQDKFITTIAEFVHDQDVKECGSEKDKAD